MFKKMNGDQALLVAKGTFKEADLFEFQGGLFAKHGSGYVRLKANGSTSKPGVDFCHLETEAELWSDPFGRISVTNRDGYKPLSLALSNEGVMQIAKA